MKLEVNKGMVKTHLGSLGYLISESAKPNQTPILCFHSSPRSADEFREVLPLLAATNRRVIAIDSPGYGISENPEHSCSVDEVADSYLEVADFLGIHSFIVLGSLMGSFPAASLSSRAPDRVEASIYVNLYYCPSLHLQVFHKGNGDDDTASTASTTSTSSAPIQETFNLKEDGSHLMDLHNQRKWLDPELNFRVIRDEISYLANRRERYAHGISIECYKTFNFETPAKKSKCPTLCIKGEEGLAFFDLIGLEGTNRFEEACGFFNECEVKSISGPKSTINLINQEPQKISEVCLSFLDEHNL